MKRGYSVINQLPFAFLEINNPIWTDKGVAARDSSNAGNSIPPGILCVSLVYSIQIRAAGRDLYRGNQR